MKKAIVMCLAILFASEMHAQTPSESCTGPMPAIADNKNSQTETYFFFQHAQSAEIKATPEPNVYNITFNNIAQKVFYVSDRPNRVAGSFELDKFLGLWNCSGNHSFKLTPPNAIIHGSTKQAGSVAQSLNISVELTEPTYNVQTNTLTYKANMLKGGTPIQDAVTMEEVSIFIDPVCLQCWDH